MSRNCEKLDIFESITIFIFILFGGLKHTKTFLPLIHNILNVIASTCYKFELNEMEVVVSHRAIGSKRGQN